MSSTSLAAEVADSDSDSEYLLSDVYARYDANGALSAGARGTPLDKASLGAAPAPYARALLDANLAFVGASARGSLSRVHEALLELRGSELLPAALDESLQGAVAAGHLRLAEYLVRRGLAPRRETLCFAVVDAAADVLVAADESAARDAASGGGGGGGGGDASAAALLSAARAGVERDARALAGVLSLGAPRGSDDGGDAGAGGDAAVSGLPGGRRRPLSHACALLWCVARVGCDASGVRASDFYSPLHLAALHGLLREAAALIALGADVNAVARDESTPLSALRLGRADARGCGAAVRARYDALEIALLDAGAVDGLAARLALGRPQPRPQSPLAWLADLHRFGGALAAAGAAERAPQPSNSAPSPTAGSGGA
jgi:hypothetical protein